MAEIDNHHSTSTDSDSELEHSTFIDFLDPLFAVAIGIGFQNGLLLEAWIKEWRFPSNTERFDLFVFILGLFIITLSWFGYHKSIKKKPLKGKGRFIVDIILLLLYIMLLFVFKKFDAFLLFLVIIYAFFSIWDFLKVLEHPENYSDTDPGFFSRYSRELITVQWLFIFTVTYLLYMGMSKSYPDGSHSIYFLIFVYLGTGLYRVDKDYKFLGTTISLSKRWLIGS